MHRRAIHPSRIGSIVTIVALLLPILLLLSAFAINKAYMELARTELQIATDAATRAASHQLLRTNSQSAAVSAARDAAELNTIGGVPGRIDSDDLVFGSAVRSSIDARYVFTPNVTPFNAVRINADALSTNSGLTMPMKFGSNPSFAPIKTATSSVVELDVCLVVDRSGSMAYAADEVAIYPPPPKNAPLIPFEVFNYDPDGLRIAPYTACRQWQFGDPVPPGARWLDAIAAVHVFLDVLTATPQPERVGLATYSHFPYGDVALTNNYSEILSRLNVYSLSYQAGGTNIGDGILQGINVLEQSQGQRPWAAKVLVVLTDGIHNIGTSPMSAAREARDQEVIIYTVTFSNEAQQSLMQDVAETASGKHFHASNANELIEAFETIARSLPTLLTE